MQVVIATTVVPFIRGGGTLIIDWLEEELVRRNHEVRVLRIPFASEFPRMPEQMVGLRTMDVSHLGERLIAVRTPSYLLQHPAKVLWFIHHHRPCFDLHGTPYQDVPNTAAGDRYVAMFREADNVALRESRRVFTNSLIVRDRLVRFNDFHDAEVLYPPLGTTSARFRCKEADGTILYVSRISHVKRQWLAVQAMAKVRSAARLVIAGAPDSPAEAALLHGLVSDLRLQDRVTVLDRFVTEEEKGDLLARCSAALYLAFDEDSYGYPTVEAFRSKKPVIGLTDGGGVRELVEHGVTGLLAEPDPSSLAAAIDDMIRRPAFAAQLGHNGAERLEDLGLNWDTTIERLLA